MTTAIIEQIIQSGQPIDWVTQNKFAELIGLPANRLYKAKENMPEYKVWQKINNKIYFSLQGWNTWLNEQATKNYQQAYASSEQAITQYQLGKMLKSFNITTQSIRFGQDVIKGYKRQQFDEVFNIYLPKKQDDEVTFLIDP